MKLMVGDNFTEEQIQSIAETTIKEADIIDNDGKISFAEFQKILKGTDVMTKLSINFWSFLKFAHKNLLLMS